MTSLSRFKRSRRGVTGVEYGMLLALIAAVVIVPVINIGVGTKQIFCEMGGAIGGAACPDAQASTTPAVQAIDFQQTAIPNIRPSDSIYSTSTGDLSGVIVGPSAEAMYPSGPLGPTYTSTGNQSLATFSASNASGSPWGAITDNSGSLAAFSAACSAGTAPAASVREVPAGPAGGIPVVTSISSTPAAELQTLQYGAQTSGASFSAGDSVVTCYAPAG